VFSSYPFWWKSGSEIRFIWKKPRSNFKSNEEIDKLVEDYRNSLILDAFEENLFNQKIDSSISDQEYLDYYNQKKAEYKLESPILRMMFVKILKQNLDQKIFQPTLGKTRRCKVAAVTKILPKQRGGKFAPNG
jgi:hypothetical protein